MDRREHRPASSRRQRALAPVGQRLGAGLATLTLTFSPGCTRHEPADGQSARSGATQLAERDAPARRPNPELASRLPAPDVAPGEQLVITSGLRGYTEPCGCSEAAMLGGIDRLAWVVRQLGRQSEVSLVIDAGDTFFQEPEFPEAIIPQERARAHVIAAGLAEMRPQLTTIGPNDLALGWATYAELTIEAATPIVATNLTEPERLVHDGDSASVQDHLVVALGAQDTHPGVRVWAVVEPALLPAPYRSAFADPREALVAAMARAEASAPTGTGAPAAAPVDIVIYHGDPATAQSVFAGLRVDFVVLPQTSVDTPAVAHIGDARGLAVFNQARAVGALRLFHTASEASPNNPTQAYLELVDPASSVASIERALARTEAHIGTLEERLHAQGEDIIGNPLVTRMQARVADYNTELRAARAALGEELTPAPDQNQFYWQTTLVSPNYPGDRAVEAAREAFNRSLRALNLAHATPPAPAAAGAPEYVGAATCQGCHSEAHDVWDQTRHAHAMATLVERDKDFDSTCVSCHVTGFDQPGGSALGHTEGLENVQCEACHGPGSLHVAAPTTMVNVPNGVVREVPASTCVTCHNAEHSSEFDYDVYLPQILGPGHGAEQGPAPRPGPRHGH